MTVRVEDNDGGAGNAGFPVVVKDFVFSIDAGSDAEANEGTAFARSIAVSGPPDKASWFVVDYGDGTASEDLALAPGALGQPGTAALSHVYLDNGTYEVALSLIDADGYSYRDSLKVTVSNVSPTVKLSKSRIESRGWIEVTGSFADPGADTWTGTIDFGDGGGPQPLSLNADKTFRLGHSYWECAMTKETRESLAVRPWW